MDKIIIEGLKVETVIGCFDWERQIKQPLLIDLTIETRLNQACLSDNLDHTLNYVELCRITTETIQKAEPKLIENAGYIVLQQLFTYYPSIEKIRIHVRKIAIVPQAQGIGIFLERKRQDFFKY